MPVSNFTQATVRRLRMIWSSGKRWRASDEAHEARDTSRSFKGPVSTCSGRRQTSHALLPKYQYALLPKYQYEEQRLKCRGSPGWTKHHLNLSKYVQPPSAMLLVCFQTKMIERHQIKSGAARHLQLRDRLSFVVVHASARSVLKSTSRLTAVQTHLGVSDVRATGD